MVDDIKEVDVKCLNRAVNEGVRYAKLNTNVDTGFMRKSWRSAPAVKSATGGVSKTLVNGADYSSFVNYGHRIVSKTGETVGFVKGQYILEKAITLVDKTLVKAYKNEMERIAKEHD